MSVYGTLDKSYHLGRKTKKSLIYRLKRRSQEVIQSIEKYYSGNPQDIIDLGTADGLMLGIIKDAFPFAKCFGIEYSQELVESSVDSRITVLQGDVNCLPILSDSFDVAIATAVIEHLPKPEVVLEEAKRVLRPDGIVVLTSPDPFWEKVATMVGHLADDQHYKVMDIKELTSLFNEVGYEVMEERKFMLSPVGMPLEIQAENIVRTFRLNFLFANQLVVGKKRKM